MTPKENMLCFLRREQCQWHPDAMDQAFMGNNDIIATLDIPVRERPMSGGGYDVFGVHWSGTDGVSHYTTGQEPIYDDIDDWQNQVKFPNIEKFEWDQMMEDLAKINREQKLVNIVLFNGPFERTTMLTSFEDCLVNLITEPEQFSALIGAIADYKIALIEKICALAHPDTFFIHDDWGTMKSTFMNPELWREVIKPHTKRIYEAIHRNGAIVIQHSCGAIAPLVEDMVEMGADAWEGQYDCNDMPTLKQQVEGRMVILDEKRIRIKTAQRPMMPNEKYGAYSEYPAFLFD